MKRACFLDRDGVLIHEECYLSDPEHVTVTAGAAQSINKLHELGFLVIVITNQAGVARGYYSEESITEVHNRIDELLAANGAAIDAYYYCPHHPQGKVEQYSIKCNCRKPATGMVEQAIKDFEIDLENSFVVGDKVTDVKTATNAGCKTGVLVRTGHGESQIAENDTDGIIIKKDINDAINWFIDKNNDVDKNMNPD